MRPWRCTVREMACSRSQHGSSTRPSWVTAVVVDGDVLLVGGVGARRRRTVPSSRSRSKPPLTSRAARRGIVLDHVDRRVRPGRARHLDRHAGHLGGGAQRRHVERRRRPVDTHQDPRHGAVAQHVGLAAQPAAVDRPRRTARPTSGGTTRRPRPSTAVRPIRRNVTKRRMSSGPPVLAPRPTDERFQPPNGCRRTMAPVVCRLT